MAVRVRRVAVLAVLVAAMLAAAWLAWQRQPRPQAGTDAAPWIGLPATGMDASQRDTRQLLARKWDERDGLARACGAPDDPAGEHYALWIGKDAWGPFRALRFDVAGDAIQVSVRGGEPPPPLPGATPTLEPPPVRVAFRRQALRQIRDLWRTEALWQAPQREGALDCLDGNPVTLEACVDGRYAVRHRNCDPAAGLATQRLWQAVVRQLPAPREPASAP
jgi:hypothetical protein